MHEKKKIPLYKIDTYLDGSKILSLSKLNKSKMISDEVFKYKMKINGEYVEDWNDKYSEEERKLRLERMKKIYAMLGENHYVDVNTNDYEGLKKQKIIKANNVGDLRKNKLVFLFSILPKDSREEANADLEDIIRDMEKNNCHKWYVRLIATLNLISVLYHTFFFKLKGYFYPSAQQSNQE